MSKRQDPFYNVKAPANTLRNQDGTPYSANADAEPLRAMSNIIELKPDKQYLFVFKGDVPMELLDRLLAALRNLGIRGMGIALDTGQELEIIEAPKG